MNLFTWSMLVCSVVVAAMFVGAKLLKRVQGTYQGVVCFEGLPGSGKTYSLAEVGLKRMAEGWTVYSNKGFELAGSIVYSSFEELMDVPDGSVILLDEAPLYFNAQKWKDFPDGMLYRFSQVRKDGLEFYYSTIDELMVDINLRRITFWTYHCKGSLFSKKRFKRWRTAPIHRLDKSKQKPGMKQTVTLDPKVCEAYDTLAKVAVRRSALVRTESDAEQWVTLEQARTPQGGPGRSGAGRGLGARSVAKSTRSNTSRSNGKGSARN